MKIPPLNRDSIIRIARAEIDCNVYGLQILQQLAGNPYEIEIRLFGESVGLMCRAFPQSFWWNRVIWLQDNLDEFLDEIIDWYESYDICCRIEFIPDLCPSRVFPMLADKNFYQCELPTIVYGVPDKNFSPPPSAIKSRIIATDEIDGFVDLWTKAMQGKRLIDKKRKDPYKIILKGSRWHCCLGMVDGIPAAAGGLYANDGNAYFALISTLPSFRNRGCQKSLLHRGIAMAISLHCDLIVSGALPGSVSLYNMHKVGLRSAFNKSIWLRKNFR